MCLGWNLEPSYLATNNLDSHLTVLNFTKYSKYNIWYLKMEFFVGGEILSY